MTGPVVPPGLRVLVTAGGSGIDRWITDLAMDTGARLQVCNASEPVLTEFITAHPRHGATLCDVLQQDDVERPFRDGCELLRGFVYDAGISVRDVSSSVRSIGPYASALTMASTLHSIDIVRCTFMKSSATSAVGSYEPCCSSDRCSDCDAASALTWATSIMCGARRTDYSVTPIAGPCSEQAVSSSRLPR